MIDHRPRLLDQWTYLDKPYFPYLIIDCAHFDESFYQTLINDTTIKARSLFLNTPHEKEALTASPVLIEFDADKSLEFLKKAFEIQSKKPAVLWLWSSLECNKLSKQLTKLLFAELENGNKLLVRFYDIRCLEGLLKVYQDDKISLRILEAIPLWAFIEEDKYRYVLSEKKNIAINEGEEFNGY